jgi:hypothetical protein
MGVIYLATQARPRRHVALKLLAPHLAADPTYRERFLREVDALAALEHPNVVPIYAAGEWEGQLYLVMRYLDGPDLAEMIRTNGPLDAWSAVRLLDPIAAALDEAHRRGIVHRDVTPSNIRLDSRGVPHLTDFGLTKRAASQGELTQIGGPLGTPAYMAPEQFAGPTLPGGAGDAGGASETAGHAPPDVALAGRIDVYALGCVLVTTLTGQPPFPRDTYEAALWAHVHEAAPSLHDRRPDLPLALDGVVARAMAKDPAARFASATGLMLEVRTALGGSPAPEPAVAPDAGPVNPHGITATRAIAPRAGPLPPHAGPLPPQSGPLPPQAAAGEPRRRIRGAAGAIGLALLVLAAGVLGLGLGLLAVGATGATPGPTATQIAGATTRLPTLAPTVAPAPTPEPTPTPTPTPAPTPRLGDPADIARLRLAVPASLRDACRILGLTLPSERAALACAADGVVDVRYTLYATPDAMNAAFRKLTSTQRFASDPETCAQGRPAKGAWGTSGFLGFGGETLGMMACWSDSSQHARIAWTLDRGPILARTSRSDSDIASLYQVWAGGRLHPTAP